MQVSYGLYVSIDPYSSVPLYLQLAAVLRDRITTGAIEPRHPLPSIDHLREEFGVARGTVLRAVEVLRGEGLVGTVPGKGVYVLPQDESGEE
jgi:GntR family transcriptional regulator